MHTDTLSAQVQALTGCDPTTEPDFAWSTEQPCDHCGTTRPTAVLSIDGDTFQRYCGDCLNEAL